MNPVIPAARDHVGEFAPKISQYTIDPEKISEVIGKQGKTINGSLMKQVLRSILTKVDVLIS